MPVKPPSTGINLDELSSVANKLVCSGKGILAADESTNSMTRKFASINMENNEQNRATYRELLFSACPQLSSFISGIIMHEETFYQSSTNGELFVNMIEKSSILVGIKVDKGTDSIYHGDNFESTNEPITKGLDGLYERCIEYRKNGAKFTKWRCVFKINHPNRPSKLAIELNANVLAQYAIISQAAGLVPIVEPDVLMDGSHDLETTHKCCREIMAAVIKKLHDFNVYMGGMLIKTNMILPGIQCPIQYSNEEIAQATVTCLAETVPPAIPGVVFLSGGLDEIRATTLLNCINKTTTSKYWKLSFSFGRALQHSVLLAWNGNAENTSKAQEVLLTRAKANSNATNGRYKIENVTTDVKMPSFSTGYDY